MEERYMLETVLSPSDCAKCEFCCSFRKQSLNLTPKFAAESVEEICKLYPEAKFKTLPNGAVTIDLDDKFISDDSSEEALCYFNREGCKLPLHLKPFDCVLWPFRLMREGDSLCLALVPSCPWIDKSDMTKLRKVAAELSKEALKYAATHPEIIIDYREDYEIIIRLSE